MSRNHPRPWHRNSVFGPGHRRALDRNDRARFRFLARAHARAGRLPPKQEWVALALLKRLGADGQCDPSYDTLAADAGCDARTARRATATLRALGLVRWQCRILRNGWRAEQTSNAYELVTTAAVPMPSCGGHPARETKKKDNSTIGRVGARAPTGSDEWALWNRDRQIALLLAG